MNDNKICFCSNLLKQATPQNTVPVPELVGESENAVDMLEKVQAAGHLRLDLVRAAEDVRVILLEPAHARQTSQRA
jgi:hypothetical protein